MHVRPAHEAGGSFYFPKLLVQLTCQGCWFRTLNPIRSLYGDANGLFPLMICASRLSRRPLVLVVIAIGNLRVKEVKRTTECKLVRLFQMVLKKKIISLHAISIWNNFYMLLCFVAATLVRSINTQWNDGVKLFSSEGLNTLMQRYIVLLLLSNVLYLVALPLSLYFYLLYLHKILQILSFWLTSLSCLGVICYRYCELCLFSGKQPFFVVRNVLCCNFSGCCSTTNY